MEDPFRYDNGSGIPAQSGLHFHQFPPPVSGGGMIPPPPPMPYSKTSTPLPQTSPFPDRDYTNSYAQP